MFIFKSFSSISAQMISKPAARIAQLVAVQVKGVVIIYFFSGCLSFTSLNANCSADVPELTVTRLLFLYLSFNFVSNASLTSP